MQQRIAEDDTEGWTRLDYAGSDGLMLAGRRYGWENRAAVPVVCLAGLTRNSADFHQLALHLSRRANRPRRVLCLDYRGRGMSAHDRDWRNYNVMTETEDVLAGMTAAGIGRAALIGTSRGGLVIFVLAAMRPTVLAAAIFNDIGPRIEGTGLVRIKSYIEHGRDFSNWAEAVAAVRAVGRTQFPEWDDAMWERQTRLIYSRDGKRVRRRYDKRLMNTLKVLNLDNPLPRLWPQFEGLKGVPVMAIRGANSDMLSAQTLEDMARRHPALETVTVEGQGHAPDLGTESVAARIAAFLAKVDKANRLA